MKIIQDLKLFWIFNIQVSFKHSAYQTMSDKELIEKLNKLLMK